MHRIGVMHYARAHGGRYLHLPFLDVAHRESDPVGRGMTPQQWARRWETFLNLGNGEPSLNTIAANRLFGRSKIRWVPGQEGTVWNDPPDGSRVVVPTSFEFIRQPGAWEYSVEPEVVETVRERFRNAGEIERPADVDERTLVVAIHIRRGDVWRVVRGASSQPDEGHRVRFVEEDYYVRIMARIARTLSAVGKKARFHVFTDGTEADFDRFRFLSGQRASLTIEDFGTIDDITFHSGDDAFHTLRELSAAPVLIPGKSAFSALAILLGDAAVIYDDFVFDLGVFSPLKRLMKTHPRFHPVNQLEAAIEMASARCAG